MSIAQDVEQVSRYLADGFKPVRLRANAKRPFEERWQLEEVSEKELHEWVREGGAIGLQMGRVSGWVGCVDLDWAEARWLAPRFLLRPTLMGAKGSESPSQYFYRCAGLPYAKFSGIKRSKGAEILSVKASDEDKGHQVCVSPSVHEVKGPYVWVDGYDASRIAEQVRGVLQHQVSLLATASLIARELPASREEGGGGRHDFAMALSGYLLRGGVAEDDVREMLVGAWEYRRAPAEAIADVEAAVRDTAATLRAGEKATGGPTVDEVVDGLSGKLAKFLSLTTQGPPMYLKPPIEVEDTTLQEAGDQALQALLDHNDPPKIFTRGGVPIRLLHDPREDEPLIQEITVDLMRFEIAQAADFIKSTKNSAKYVFPPKDLVTYVRSHTGLSNLPAFLSVTRCPVVRPDGSILLEAGFDDATGLWFAPQAGLDIPRVSEDPSEQELEQAREIAWQQIADFPFVGRASAANILAYPLSLIMRPAIDGHVPLLLIDKPEVGTGASLLVDMLSMAILGKSAGAVGAPASGDDAEMRKLITAALRHTRQVVFFDNVATELKHASLARALTISFWEDRLLGHSLVVRLAQRSAWIATGNNIAVSSEIARRSYKCRLDAKQERPWEGRQFAIPDLNRWTIENRGKLLWAYLTMARNYFSKGKPIPEVKPIGMFESWTEVIGGVLEAAGFNDFLANRAELYETTTDSGGDWYAFLSAWSGVYGQTPKTTKAFVADLYDTADDSFKDLRSTLPDDFGSIDPNRPDTKLSRRLGNAFKAREGRRFGVEGLHLVRAGSTHGALRWKVTTPESSPEEDVEIRLEGLLED